MSFKAAQYKYDNMAPPEDPPECDECGKFVTECKCEEEEEDDNEPEPNKDIQRA